MRRSLLLLGIAAAALSLVATAGAVPPTTEALHFEDAFDIDCGTFVLHEEFATDVRVTTYFDNAGNPDHLIVHEQFRGFIETPDGTFIADPGNINTFVDLAGTPDDESDDTARQTGMIFAITVPGHGIVAHDTGLIIFEPDGDVIIRGPHEVFEQGLEPLLCPVFA
ncbi:MAG: hypothetical protein ACRDOF_10175 [Gaiellaceae bacterium]